MYEDQLGKIVKILVKSDSGNDDRRGTLRFFAPKVGVALEDAYDSSDNQVGDCFIPWEIFAGMDFNDKTTRDEVKQLRVDNSE